MITTRRRLTRKLLLLLALPPLLGVSGLGLLTNYDRRQEMLAEADRELADHAETLHSTLPILAETTDRKRLAQTVDGIARLERVHGIALYDRECQPIALSSDLKQSSEQVAKLACGAEAPQAGIPVFVGPHEVLVRVVQVENSRHVRALVVTYHLEEVERIIRSGAMRMALAGALLAALMAAVAILLARGAGKSLGSMMQAAGQIAAGDLSVRVASSEFFELGRLGNSFNAMAGALEESRKNLEQAQARHRELERRLHHAQSLHVVGQVAASLAHEIASPLSTILGWSRLLSSEEDLPAGMREQAGVISTQCERITRIVGRLLTVARPEGETRQEVFLPKVVRAVQDFLGGECRQSGIIQETQVTQEPGTIWANPDRCLQIIMNLCVNAIQAQPRGGKLVVALAPAIIPTALEDEEAVLVEVRDAGPGIPIERRASIFEPFFSTKAEKGMGLGLSIVRDLVEELGGTLEVGGAPEGGANFRVLLPCTKRPGTLC